MTKLSIRPRIIEAAVATKNKTAKCVLISEGPGASQGGCYYPASTLKAAVDKFEGTQCFANHATDGVIQPIEELIGYFKEVKAVQRGGKTQIEGTLVITTDDESLLNKIREAVKQG